MRQETRDLAREDRTATLHELCQVIDLLIAKNQLPLTSVTSHESEGSRSKGEELEIWTEADLERLWTADVERLTNVILGRSPRFN